MAWPCGREVVIRLDLIVGVWESARFGFVGLFCNLPKFRIWA